jgi:hypothetical protein
MGDLEKREAAIQASRERVCGHCGRTFLISDTPARWVYRIILSDRLIQYCSYHCWIAEKRARERDEA